MASNTNYFAMQDDYNEFEMWQGLRGPFFQPHVASDGTLSWTNNGGLTNPDPVNIKGADGQSAYEAAVEAGFTGTEAEFNTYLSGIGVLTQEVADQKSAIDGKQDAPADSGTAGQVLGLDDDLNPVWLDQTGGGGGGTTNYNNLTNKPRINGVLLSGDKSAADLGLAAASDIPTVPVQSVNGKTGAVVLGASDVGALPSSTAIPSKTSDLTNDSGFVNASGAAAAAPVQSVNGSVGAVTVQSTITANGILKGNGSGGVSAATKGTDYGALAFTVTLTAAGWSSNAQTVSNANFVASGYGYIVSPASGSFADYASAQIYADDVTVAGQMTFHCTTAPSAALTVNILRVVSA